ncbi:MAG TPA: outer membrane beta-barrel family protein [Puia sp.]|nr:outer membrane beta-barrel family protein [Puia sp.]
MNRILITIGCFFLLSHASTQGVIKDSITGVGIRFATVELRNRSNDSIWQTAITDEKGRFRFRTPPSGDFDIRVTSIGYFSKTVPVTAGLILLCPGTDMLKEVVVDGRRSLIEERLDRTVYNVERDRSLLGGDATDALRHVPLLSVDIDGNVTLRGSANLKVLINGKPSTITADNLADALKQIPADQIKSIEVITSPSVKYDAEGSAGIINIVLKQNRLKGIILNPDMAIGTRAAFLGIDGAYNNRTMGFSVGGFGRASYNVTGAYHNVQQVGQSSMDQTAAVRKNDIAANYNAGWEFEPDSDNVLTASLRYTELNNQNDQNNLLTRFYPSATPGGLPPDSTLLDQVAVANRSGTVDASFDYTHTFDRPQREFSLLTLYSRTDRTTGFTTLRQDPLTDTLTGRLRNNDQSSNQEITWQADFQTPIDSTQLLELGGKFITRQVSSNYQYFSASGDKDYLPDASPFLSNQFRYHQNITAAYLEYTWTPKASYSLRAGLRYEYTAITARLVYSAAAITIPSYDVWAPAVNFGRKLNNGKLIRLSWTVRIQRPSIQFLNPNVVASNPGTLATGNPALGPEHSNDLELGYNTAIGATTIGFAAFYRHTTNSIESISLSTPNGDTITRSYANIGKESTTGLDVFYNLLVGDKLSLSGGADLFYTTLANPPLRNSGWVVSARLSGGYTFIKGWSIYLYSFFRGSQVLLQGYQTGYPFYSLTLKRDLKNKKGTLGVGAENFLGSGITVSNTISSSGISQSSTTLTHVLSLRIYMSLRFGKLKVEKAERQKKSVVNDDLKQ